MISFKPSRPLGLLIFCLFAALSLSGCRLNSRTDSADAQVRLINAVSDTPEVSVSVDDQKAWKHSYYRSNTGYQAIGTGSYAVRVDAGDTGATLMATEALSFEAQKSYTLLALGLEHDPQFPARVEILSDKPKVPIPAGKASVLFIHASPGFGAADVLLNNIVGLKSISYNKRSDPVLLDSGAYDVKVNPADSPDSVLGPVNFTFDSGRAYTLVLMGQPSSSSFTIEAYPDNG